SCAHPAAPAAYGVTHVWSVRRQAGPRRPGRAVRGRGRDRPGAAAGLDIAPTDLVPVVVLRHRPGDPGGPEVRQLRAAKWGLVPSWASDTGRAAKLINARAETVTELPAFRSAVRRRRCLVPADGWY